MTRLLFIADLHFPGGSDSSGGVTLSAQWGLASLVWQGGFDAVVLVGDFVSLATSETVRGLVRLIRRGGYNGPVYVVLGNHEHYLSWRRLSSGWDSFRHVDWLRGLLEEHGFIVVDRNGPICFHGFCLVGSVGWYDYSLAPEGLTIQQLENCNPYGIPLHAARRCAKLSFYARNPALCSRFRGDCFHVKLPVKHPEYARLNLEKLRRQVEEASDKPVIVVTHHAPLRGLITYTGDIFRDFDYAYAGSAMLGEYALSLRDRLLAYIYGHLHRRTKTQVALVNNTFFVNAYPCYTGEPRAVVVEVEAEANSVAVKVRTVHVKGKC